MAAPSGQPVGWRALGGSASVQVPTTDSQVAPKLRPGWTSVTLSTPGFAFCPGPSPATASHTQPMGHVALAPPAMLSAGPHSPRLVFVRQSCPSRSATPLTQLHPSIVRAATAASATPVAQPTVPPPPTTTMQPPTTIAPPTTTAPTLAAAMPVQTVIAPAPSPVSAPAPSISGLANPCSALPDQTQSGELTARQSSLGAHFVPAVRRANSATSTPGAPWTPSPPGRRRGITSPISSEVRRQARSFSPSPRAANSSQVHTPSRGSAPSPGHTNAITSAAATEESQTADKWLCNQLHTRILDTRNTVAEIGGAMQVQADKLDSTVQKLEKELRDVSRVDPSATEADLQEQLKEAHSRCLMLEEALEARKSQAEITSKLVMIREAELQEALRRLNGSQAGDVRPDSNSVSGARAEGVGLEVSQSSDQQTTSTMGSISGTWGPLSEGDLVFRPGQWRQLINEPTSTRIREDGKTAERNSGAATHSTVPRRASTGPTSSPGPSSSSNQRHPPASARGAIKPGDGAEEGGSAASPKKPRSRSETSRTFSGLGGGDNRLRRRPHGRAGSPSKGQPREKLRAPSHKPDRLSSSSGQAG